MVDITLKGDDRKVRAEASSERVHPRVHTASKMNGHDKDMGGRLIFLSVQL